MYDHCEYCLGPSCNLNKTELETLYTFKSRATKATTRSTKATTTTDALDNETDEPESTKGPKKTARSTKRTRRPRASKRPNTPTPETFTDAAVAAHPFAVPPAVLLPFCLSLFFRQDSFQINGTIPQRNRWDSAACAKNLSLSEPERLIAQFTEVEDWGDRAVLAEQPIISKGNSGIFYFEMQILAQKLIDVNTVYIGLSTKETPLDRRFVLYNGTYAYGSNGLFWGNPVAGPFNRDNGQAWVDGKPSFGIGDVVGCGVNLATRQIIYTKNGRPLDTANLFVDSVDKLFPCVSLDYPGDKIEANFGPNFVYQF
uniref:B30.2/SPRY domain-containing protein n=1 Tax=Globodera pallida TaxID=36090 RepID=A0A183BY68_GLOPA